MQGYQIFTIEIPTVLNENEEHDKFFFEYLEEYSIDYFLTEETVDGYPVVSYSSGPIALKNMLRERFGYSNSEIAEAFPDLV